MFQSARQKLGLHWSRKVLSRFTRDAKPQDLPVTLVVPLAPKDVERARVSIPLMQSRIAHPIQGVTIVAPRDPKVAALCQDLNIRLIDEAEPLTEMLGDRFPNTSGWHKQQFLKLSAPRFLSADNVVVMDADTYPIRPTAFTDGKRTILYRGDPNREPFRLFTDNLIGPSPTRPANFVAHCMLFYGPWLEELFTLIETRHQRPWADAMLDLAQNPANGAMSEYDIYGCFVTRTRPEAIVRPYYAGIKVPPAEFLGERPLAPWKRRFRFVSNHERG